MKKIHLKLLLDSVAPVFEIKDDFFFYYKDQNIWQPRQESQRVWIRWYPEKNFLKFFLKKFFFYILFFNTFKSPFDSRDVIFCDCEVLSNCLRLKILSDFIWLYIKKQNETKNFFKKNFQKFFFRVPPYPNTLRLSPGLSNVLLLSSLLDRPAKKQILWRRSIKIEFGHFFTFQQFFSSKFLVKF